MSASSAFADTSVFDPVIIQDVQEAHGKLQNAIKSLKTVIFGQDDLLELTIACLVAGGNVSLEGPPGVAKTLLISQIANVLNIPGKRVQFTPDLMPSEITGSHVLNKKASKDPDADPFIFRKGPVFTGLLLADEINRASPKTQAALLQAMQEKEVTADGETHPLSRNFRVAAAQNPKESEGTSPLPDAQLDRFMFQLNVKNTDREAEIKIAKSQTTNRPGRYSELKARFKKGENIDVPETSEQIVLKPVLLENELILFETLLKELPISEELYQDIVDLVRATRPDDETAPKFISETFAQGSNGARAIIALAKAMQARALIRGDYAPDYSDLKAVAVPVLAHRVRVKKSRDMGSEEKLIKNLLDHILQ